MSARIDEKAIKSLKEKVASRVDYFSLEDKCLLSRVENNIQEFCLFKSRNDWESVRESRAIIENLLDKVYRLYGIAITVEKLVIVD